MNDAQNLTTELHMKVKTALREFFCEDSDLLYLDASEKSITHKLAEHLQRQFTDRENLKVDCEYNRYDADKYPAKRLSYEDKTSPTDRSKGKLVYPDIVVHRRASNADNKIVIEVKKSNTTNKNRDKDRKRLRAFTKREGKYGYKLGLFLEFYVDKRSGLKRAECYQDGEKIKPCCCGESLLEKFGSTRSGRRADDSADDS